MNETEYLLSRIKDIESVLKNEKLPLNIRQNQQTALLNYKSELERIRNNSL